MTYRTSAQIEWVMELLAGWFPQLCTRFPLPNPSVEGRQIHALRMRAGSGANRRGVLVVGGLHARELMNPDAIVDLQLDLVRAYLGGTGLVLGGKSFTAIDIKVILESLDVWMVPNANPDGREYVLQHDDLWRKNRRDNPGTTCDGVDLNRNFDVVWGVTSSHASCNPCSIQYVGPAAFSEPESRNIKSLLDAHRIDVFLDVHSYSELVLYPWGHAPTQTTDPSQRFTSLATGTCLPISPSTHREYMTYRDRVRYQTVARRVAETISTVRGRTYRREPVFELYDTATTGTASEYAYSRHIANPALRKTYGFAMETGPYVGNDKDSFHPTDPSLIQRDTKAGILALLQQSICAIELIGGLFPRGLTVVDAVRGVRDTSLSKTKSGRAWIDLFERVQARVLGAVLIDESMTRMAMAFLERSGELLDGNGKITEADVERGLTFLDTLALVRLPKPVRRDLKDVRRVVKRSAGKTPKALLKQLTKTPPQRARAARR